MAQYLSCDADETTYTQTYDSSTRQVKVNIDTVIEQIKNHYDDASNAWLTRRFQRHDNATGTGELNDPGGNQPKARVTYTVAWFDALGRTTKTVFYGDNGNGVIDDKDNGDFNSDEAGTPAYFAGGPEPDTSNFYIVAKYDYDSAGRLYRITDNLAKITQKTFDALGRVTKTIENFTGDGSITETTAGDVNRTTGYVFDVKGRLAYLNARNPKGADNGVEDQKTYYVYGDSVNAALPTKIVYPDTQDTVAGDDANGGYIISGVISVGQNDTDHVAVAYDYLGRAVTRTDQRGTAHAFDYVANASSGAGQLEKDRVTALGGADNYVQSVKYEYDDLGRKNAVTSYGSNDCTTSARSGVLVTYNGWGGISKSRQDHAAAADDNDPGVDYTSDDGADGNGNAAYVRLTQVTYPGPSTHREVYYNYPGSGIGANLSRLSDVADGDGGNRAKYADYTYLGAGTIVKVAHPQVTGGLALTYGTGGTYGGFDRFGRVVDQRWQNDTPAVLDQFKYGYDRASNRIWRDVGPDMGTPPTGKDEFYIYDGLHRLIKANRGTLAGSPLTIADADAGASQAWAAWSGSQWQSRLDALGNWPMFKQDDNGGGSGDSGWELSQTRLHNKVNEIDNNDSHSDAPSGSITGGSWVLPVHDAAGNMTCAPRPGQESTANEGLLMVYDAWNRQAAVYRDANGDGTKDANDPLIQEARYDGLNRRITKIVRHVQGETVTYDRTDYYYNEGWQCLEERTGSHASLGEYPPNASGARGTVATAVKVQWLWDIRYIDAPVLRWRDADNDENHTLEETLYYCDDANMNVTALVNASGAVVERYAYDPYGKVTILDGTTGGQTEWAADADQKSDVDNEILYCGYRLDPETGLYQVRHRSYHPTLGRFVQRDPIWYANGMSLYAYVSYRPCSLRDPMGLAIAWDDTAYENVIEPSIGKAIKSGTLQTESTIQGKDFSANDCMGTKGCNVKFTFTRAMKGDYSVFGIQYSGVYVGIKVSATAACCCDMVLLIQVASPFKMEKGKKVRTGADTDDKRSRQGWENPNAPSRGWAVDSGDGESSPFYDTGNPGLAKYKQPAWMWDAPAAPSTARNEGLDIITCAICYNKTKDNKQEGRKWAGNLLACLQWGFYVNASGAVDFAPSLPAASDETPQTFVNALKRFEGIPGNESAGIEGISRETPTTIEGVWLTRH